MQYIYSYIKGNGNNSDNTEDFEIHIAAVQFLHLQYHRSSNVVVVRVVVVVQCSINKTVLVVMTNRNITCSTQGDITHPSSIYIYSKYNILWHRNIYI